MTIGSAIAIYFVIWWVTLFAILPFRVRSQVEAGEVSPGSDPGAPAKFHMGWYLVVNTLVAGVVYLLFWFVLLPMI